MAEYRVAQLDEIEETDDGRCPWRPVRHHLGITSFGVNAWTGKEAGDRIINEHDEKDEQEELYVVQSGRARFELDGESVDAPTGTLVFAKQGVKRTGFAEEPGTTILCIGGTPGQAYEVSGWELWMPFHGLYQEGKYGEAADAAREAVEAGGYAMPLYNLACCEALAGRKDDAMEHLRASFAAAPNNERLRAIAREDDDLDPIREESGFAELVA
jgi:mannose-6-phosphate isomerase-like protein (cupin superfamily)